MIRNTEIYSTQNFILSKAKNSSCGPSIDNTMTMFMLLKSPKDECEISTWRATQLLSKCNTFTHDFHMLLVVNSSMNNKNTKMKSIILTAYNKMIFT